MQPALTERAATRPLGPPTLPQTKLSPQPIADRQQACGYSLTLMLKLTSVRTLFTQFEKLVSVDRGSPLIWQYSVILPQQPALAHDSSIDQESEVSTTTRNVKAYKMAIHQAAVSISRRTPPDRIPHLSIGTVKQCREAAEAAKVASASKLTQERVAGYCHDPSDLIEWGYPDFNNPQLLSPPDPSSLPMDTQACERCKAIFSPNVTYEQGDCVYHYGRPRPERREGRRVWLYTCCGKERGTPGCQDGIHVFSFKEDDLKLAIVEPYRTTEQVFGERATPSTRPIDIVGMDCEMICASARGDSG